MNIRYRILVGGKSRLDGPIRKSLEEAWNAFYEKFQNFDEFPCHMTITPGCRKDFGREWSVMTDKDVEALQFWVSEIENKHKFYVSRFSY